MEPGYTTRRFIAWTIAGWFASASVAGAEPGPSSEFATFFRAEIGDLNLPHSGELPDPQWGVWPCVGGQPPEDEPAPALYLESELELSEISLAGQDWLESELERIQPYCAGAGRAVSFIVTLASEGCFELTLEALDGEPIESGAFASSDSSFRINWLEWGERGELLALDADFEAGGFGDDPVLGRITWNTSWDPEEPPFVGLTDEEYELSYSGQATLTECDAATAIGVARGPFPVDPFGHWNSIDGPGDPPTVPSGMGDRADAPRPVDGRTLSTLATSDPTSTSVDDPDRPPKLDKRTTHPGIRVDAIRYSKEPAQSPSDARRRVAREIAQLYRAGSFAESPGLPEDPPVPESDLFIESATRSGRSQFPLTGWLEPGRGNPNEWPNPEEIALDRDSESEPQRTANSGNESEYESEYESDDEPDYEPEMESESDSLTQWDWPASAEDSFANLSDEAPQTALELAAGAQSADNKRTGPATALVGSGPTPSVTPAADKRLTLETLLLDWVVASSAAITELLERASALWLEVSS